MPSIVTESFRLASAQVRVERSVGEHTGDESFAISIDLGNASDAPRVDLFGLLRSDLERLYAAINAALIEADGCVPSEVAPMSESEALPFGRAEGE